MVQTIQQTAEIFQLLFDSRWSMPLLCWSCLPCRARVDNDSIMAWSRTAVNCGFFAVAVHCWSSTFFVPQRKIPWSSLFNRPQRFPYCCSISGGRCPC